MPSDGRPSAEEHAADADAESGGAGDRLPILATVFAAYRFIGEHIVGFIGVAALVGVVQYLLISQQLSFPATADFWPRDLTLH
jgi:hypothetical protein